MNIKRNIFAVLAAAVLLASCSQDEVMTDTGPDGLVPVTLSAAVGDGVQTRVIGDYDDEAEYYYVQVCRPDGTAYTDNDYATPTRLTDDNQDNIFTANIYLKADETYVFLFWADNSTTDIPTDLHNVAYKKGSIAFANRVKKKISKTDPTIETLLNHVVAKVTLKTTTDVEAGSKISVTVPTTYTTYNVNAYSSDATASTNLPVGGAVTNELFSPEPEDEPLSAITGTEEGTVVFSFYALVDGTNQDLTLTNGTNSQQVTSVPLAPNMHTTLVGDVQNIGLTDVTFTASIDGKWDDTKTEIIGLEIADGGTTYIVSSPAALEAWATEVQNDASLNCTLADDITLPVVTDGGSNWMPIQGYAGTFDGNGKTITGLTINKSTMNVGLFASIAEGGTVKNLTLDDVNITASSSNVGAIAGENRGIIENCSVSGSVTSSRMSSNWVGGIVGLNNGTITGCTVEGSVKAKDVDTAGGIAGWHYNGSITDCHSSATVEGLSRVGGIAGQSNASITACSSTGDVTATKNSMDYSWAGGVVGEFAGRSQLIACYATGNVKGTGKHVGGVVGDNVYNAVIACYATGSVTGASGSTGGVVGRNFKDDFSSGTVTASYWDNNQSSGIGEDQTNNGETTKVTSGDWTEAMSAMNVALTNAGADWRYVTGSDGVPLTLQRQN